MPDWELRDCEMVALDLLLKLQVLLWIGAVQGRSEDRNRAPAGFNGCPVCRCVDAFCQAAHYHNSLLNQCPSNLGRRVKAFGRGLPRAYDCYPWPRERNLHRAGCKKPRRSELPFYLIQRTQKLF